MINLLVFLTTVETDRGRRAQIVGHLVGFGDINEGRRLFEEHKQDTEHTDAWGKTHKLTEIRLYRVRLVEFIDK